MPPTTLNPFINGHRYDFSSLSVRILTVRFFEFQDLSYKDKLTPGSVRGTGAARRGRTRGVYDTDGCSFTMYKQEFDLFTTALQLKNPLAGIGEIPFDIMAIYNELGQPPISDVLVGARLTDIDDSPKEGADALVTKASIDVMKIIRNGKSLIKNFPF